MDVPVYLFTGFLESGKTKLIGETLSRPDFFERGQKTLVIQFEEGEEELDPAEFASDDVALEVIDTPRRMNPDKLASLVRAHGANIVIVEYNGMWLLSDFFQAMPQEWFVFQEMFVADASTIGVYNANMRNLVVDKLTSADLVLFNRCDDDTDYDALHKLVRGVTRRPDIIYENVNGQAAYDDIEDPLPFDVDAPVIEVGDSDYALFYRDMAENLENYDGKTVSFLGQISSMPNVPADGFVIGRPVMTCCVEDIAFSGLLCENGAGKVSGTEWARVKGKITVKDCELYGRRGPVMRLISAEPAPAPEDPVSTFY